jgi:hypothetical protein
MALRRRLVRSGLGAAVFAVAASAIVAAPAPAAGPKFPRGGKWVMVGDLKGTFTVTSGGKVTGVHGTIGKLVQPATDWCGAGTIIVKAVLSITDAKGSSAYGAYDSYVVGRNDPLSVPWILPTTVELARSGRNAKGKIDIVFYPDGVSGGGEIAYTTTGQSGGPCELHFNVKPA